MEILTTQCSQTTLSKNMAWGKKMLPSFILCYWAFFWHTASLCACLLPPNTVWKPHFTLIGIIDTYANRANSPRQHRILWHPRQKVDLAGWLVRVQRHALAQGHTQKCSHVRQSSSPSHSVLRGFNQQLRSLKVTDQSPKTVTKFQSFWEAAWE